MSNLGGDKFQAGDMNVNAGGDVTVGGDVTGRDKYAIHVNIFYPTAVGNPSPSSEKKLGRQRIFLSYKQGGVSDELLAKRLYMSLARQHHVFVDQQVPMGTEWRTRIQAELESCDFFISLLSKESVTSEMVEYEISTAHHLGRTRDGKPRILPIRVAYRQPFQYPLDAYLNHISWAIWDSEVDTDRLVAEMLTAIEGSELSLVDVGAKTAVLEPAPLSSLTRPRPYANPPQLERPDGTMDPESKFYIERQGDKICRRELDRQGVTIVIKAPRQMGKSSLLVRASQHAARAGRAIAFLDFHLLDEKTLGDPEKFFKGYCHWIADELGLTDTVESFWKSTLGNVQLCTKYVRHHVLDAIDSPLMLAMDEVDRMLVCPFRSDFFGMLRSWHNSRTISKEWRKLDLVLVISTEPYLLIDESYQSPFNVGEVIRLDSFTPEQVADLNQRHREPFSQQQLKHLMVLLGGHPYLVRQALYRVACGEYAAHEFLVKALDDKGPFSDHLRRHLARFAAQPQLLVAMREIIHHHVCSDEKLFIHLNGAGLVTRKGNGVVPRCKLYELYFRERLGSD